MLASNVAQARQESASLHRKSRNGACVRAADQKTADLSPGSSALDARRTKRCEVDFARFLMAL